MSVKDQVLAAMDVALQSGELKSITFSKEGFMLARNEARSIDADLLWSTGPVGGWHYLGLAVLHDQSPTAAPWVVNHDSRYERFVLMHPTADPSNKPVDI